MVEKAKRYVQKLMAGDASGHDYFHTLRVLQVAEAIAREEGTRNRLDMEALRLTALLHDVDDRKLSPKTHENLDNARNFLRDNGMDPVRAERILSDIKNLSFRGTGSTVPESLEGKIVQDADRLDAMGAIGIARAFAFGGSRGRELYNPYQGQNMNRDGDPYTKGEGHTIRHFYEKLLLLKDLMNTETGKGMACHRHAYMEAFLEEFYGEWRGDR